MNTNYKKKKYTCFCLVIRIIKTHEETKKKCKRRLTKVEGEWTCERKCRNVNETLTETLMET